MPNIELNKTTSTNFELIFPLIPSETNISATNELVLNISTATVPSIILDEEEHRWQAFRIYTHQGTVVFDPLSITFVVDVEYKNWKVLFDWIVYINNNYNKAGMEFDKYTIDSSLNILNNFGSTVLSLDFKNMWIQSLGELSMSYKEGEIVIECQATFRYDRYLVKT